MELSENSEPMIGDIDSPSIPFNEIPSVQGKIINNPD